jgi:AcrR family transcriptional regulator
MAAVPAPAQADKPNGPRSSKGMRTRARLLDAAEDVFEVRGYSDTRISDIAERAGLSYGSLYHYFSSKEEIFREVAAAQERELGPRLSADDVDVSEVADGIDAANREYLDEYRREARIMGVIEQVSRHDEVVSSARFDRYRRDAERLAQAIAQLQHGQAADAAIDPTFGAYGLIAMVTRFAEAWFVEGRLDCSFEDGVAQLNRLCRNALGQRRGRAS